MAEPKKEKKCKKEKKMTLKKAKTKAKKDIEDLKHRLPNLITGFIKDNVLSK